MFQVGGGNCSLCGSPNTNKSTCPCNPDVINPNYEKHPLSKICMDDKLTRQKSPPKPVVIQKSPKAPIDLSINDLISYHSYDLEDILRNEAPWGKSYDLGAFQSYSMRGLGYNPSEIISEMRKRGIDIKIGKYYAYKSKSAADPVRLQRKTSTDVKHKSLDWGELPLYNKNDPIRKKLLEKIALNIDKYLRDTYPFGEKITLNRDEWRNIFQLVLKYDYTGIPNPIIEKEIIDNLKNLGINMEPPSGLFNRSQWKYIIEIGPKVPPSKMIQYLALGLNIQEPILRAISKVNPNLRI